MNAFAPTHLICWTPAGGEEQTCEVMLRANGESPTRIEHAWGMRPHWRYTTEGGRWTNPYWLCDGQATPGGANGTVEVLPLPPCDGTIHEAAQDAADEWTARCLSGWTGELPDRTSLDHLWEVACRSHDSLRDLPPDESRAGLAVFSAEVRRILGGA